MTNTKTVQTLFHLSQLMSNQQYVPQYAKNKILIEAFFEPSTRTCLSFECAMKKLGGNVIMFHPQTSSKQKGESDMDTLITLTHYGDALLLRHPDHEFYDQATKSLSIPIINGGSGGKLHPTQALLDLYTMYKKFGNDFENKTILFVGDIHQSRTIHSFVHLLHLFPNTKIYFHPYENCEPNKEYIQKVAYIHNQNEENMVVYANELNYGDYDVVYLTRYQKERHHNIHHNPSSCLTNLNSYVFTYENANEMKKDAIIMHPFPRNQELDRRVDQHPCAYYFQQSKYGVELRMAILEKLFKDMHESKNHSITTSNKSSYKPSLMDTTIFLCNAINIGTFIQSGNMYQICVILFIYGCTQLWMRNN